MSARLRGLLLGLCLLLAACSGSSGTSPAASGNILGQAGHPGQIGQGGALP